MKKLSLLFLLSILFQSCFSYKSVDFKSISIEKKQNKEELIRFLTKQKTK